MKLLVVGGGGREHAIIKSLKKNPNVTEIFALPGNGGIAADAVCVPIGATEIDKIVAFAQEQKVDYAVVAPDDPLVLGCVDALEAAKIPCFGPRARAAIIVVRIPVLEGLSCLSCGSRRYCIFTALDCLFCLNDIYIFVQFIAPITESYSKIFYQGCIFHREIIGFSKFIQITVLRTA